MYQTARAEVMEKGVAIEEGISGILGFILDIDYASSKSLGYTSSALSFNAKVNLLTDLKFVPTEIAKQFILFAEIRNKFAHVQYVDSFIKCFELLDKKNYLIKHFGKALPPDTEEEIALRVCFDFLCMHLGLWMNLILTRSHHLKSENLKRVAVVEMLRSFFGESTNPNEDNEQFLNHIDSMIKDIEQDRDFMQSVEEARKAGENK